MEDIKILTNYIASWAWHLVAVMMLCTAIVSAMLNKIPYIIGLSIIVGVAEYMAVRRQRDIYAN